MTRGDDYLERPSPKGDWMLRAACRGTDPDVFFPPEHGSSVEAKAICARCPVRPECLDYALSNHERGGIWGGVGDKERQRLRAAGSGRRPALSRTVCGTLQGWRKHRMRGEDPCAPCRAAHAATVPPYGAFPK